MLRTIAYIFGIFMVAVGVLAFLPVLSPNGLFLGLFAVNLWHNVLAILIGVFALLAAYGYYSPRTYFQVFGVIFAILAIYGYVNGVAPLFGVVANNTADTVIHTIFALGSLYLGFTPESKVVLPRE
jgi:Domain of unknown function (DUF4383)